MLVNKYIALNSNMHVKFVYTYLTISLDLKLNTI